MADHIIFDLIDNLIRPGRYEGRWGWHDDHRGKDGTTDYAPALQQVRAEFSELVTALNEEKGILGGTMVQLGLGECSASHDVWAALFARRAITIDHKKMLGTMGGTTHAYPGADTHSAPGLHFAKAYKPPDGFDFLFIDAGHEYHDVYADFRDYGRLVRPGGIIAFHDALKRDGYPELGVWQFLANQIPHDQLNVIGSEVGIAWIRKP